MISDNGMFLKRMSIRKYINSYLFVVFATAVVALLSGRAETMPEYSDVLAKDCAYCHVDSSGGGELTDKGTDFSAFLKEDDAATEESVSEPPLAKKALWFLVGFVHFSAGFIWLGAIIYIHLVLKPTYAASGLPKSELRLAWLCMFFIGLSGALLTFRDFSSVDVMLSTNFGRIIFAKIIVFLTMLSSAAFVTLFIGPRIRTKPASADSADVDLSKGLTGAQLAIFDGNESRKAYVAVDGKIYDVSESRLWKDGSHMKRHKAGADMTSAMADAPHGREVMERVPEASVLIETPVPGDAIKKVFYFLAYLNLIFVFVIIFLLSALRFWSF